MFVAGLGTGGTLTGVGHGLKKYNPNIKIVAAEPPAGDLVQGLRSLEDGYIPPILDASVIDRKFIVNSKDAFRATRALFEQEGIFAGISSGAAFHVALRAAASIEGPVVVLLADGGWKYLSTGVHTDDAERGREGPGRTDLVVSDSGNDRPIGIFDSGLGGLTVARAIIDVLPHESIVYFGDSERTPYGPKPLEVVHRYSNEIIDYLLSRDVKMIVVGCNSASAALNQLGRPELPVPMVTVIEPPADRRHGLTRNKRVGIIGTKRRSGRASTKKRC